MAYWINSKEVQIGDEVVVGPRTVIKIARFEQNTKASFWGKNYCTKPISGLVEKLSVWSL